MAQILGASVATPTIVLGAENSVTDLAAVLPPRAAAHLPQMTKRRAFASSTSSFRSAKQPDSERWRSGIRFVEHALPLAASAARALEEAGCRPDDVSALVCVSGTSSRAVARQLADP
jgi:predicted naringenin-chalcone synthase